MSWDRLQCAVLAELGLVPYRLVPARVDAGAFGRNAAPAPLGTREAAMLHKLAQAARMSPEQLCAHADILLAQLPRLRLDPALKRAWWPRLRALRRGRP